MYKPDKATTERNAKTLRELVKQPDNKLCADCKRNGEHTTFFFVSLSSQMHAQILGGHRGTCEDSFSVPFLLHKLISVHFQWGISLHTMFRHPPRDGHAHQSRQIHRPRRVDPRTDGGIPTSPSNPYRRSPFLPSPSKNGATVAQTSTGKSISKQAMSLPTSESRPFRTVMFSHFLTPPRPTAKWNHLSARNTNRGDGPWTVLPPQIHPSSTPRHSLLPMGTQSPALPLSPHRSLTPPLRRRQYLPALRTHPPRVSPPPAPPLPPSSLLLPFAKAPSILTLNLDNSSPPPSQGASRLPLHRPNHPSLSLSLSPRPSPNNNRKPKMISSRSTFTRPLSRNPPRHPKPQPKMSNRTFSPSSPRPPRQLRRHSPSNPRTHSVSSRPPRSHPGMRLALPPPPHIHHRNRNHTSRLV